MKVVSRYLAVTGLMLLLAPIGCGGIGRFHVVVSPDESLAEESIEVHIVALSVVNSATLTNKSMTDYWKNPQQRNDLAVMKFGVGLPDQRVLPRESHVWNVWKEHGATKLFVLSSYPQGAKDQVGNADPRRLILPLDKDAWPCDGPLWFGDETIRITIRPKPGGLECLTASKAVR